MDLTNSHLLKKKEKKKWKDKTGKEKAISVLLGTKKAIGMIIRFFAKLFLVLFVLLFVIVLNLLFA